MKIVKSRKVASQLIKGVRETVQNEAKQQKGGFLSLLLGTLRASLLRNLLTSKAVMRAGEGTIKETRIFNAGLSFN